MEKIPEKVTFRLDYTVRGKLENWMVKHPNVKLSYLVRKALRVWLEEQFSKQGLDSGPTLSSSATASDKTPTAKADGESSMVEKLKQEKSRLEVKLHFQSQSLDVAEQDRSVLVEIARIVGHACIDQGLIDAVYKLVKKPAGKKAKAV